MGNDVVGVCTLSLSMNIYKTYRVYTVGSELHKELEQEYNRNGEGSFTVQTAYPIFANYAGLILSIIGISWHLLALYRRPNFEALLDQLYICSQISNQAGDFL